MRASKSRRGYIAPRSERPRNSMYSGAVGGSPAAYRIMPVGYLPPGPPPFLFQLCCGAMKLPDRNLLIDGEWVPALSGETFTTTNPASEAPSGTLAKAGEADVDRAALAARKAFDEGPWPRMAPAERARILWRAATRMRERAEDLARCEALDMGKPVSEGKAIDVPFTADLFEYYAGWATKVAGETLPGIPGFFVHTLREPVGVVGMITPWNFPMLLLSWKLAPALAVGCTCVVKPASLTPHSALLLAEILV